MEVVRSELPVPENGQEIVARISRLLVLVGITESVAMQDRLWSRINALADQVEELHRAEENARIVEN